MGQKQGVDLVGADMRSQSREQHIIRVFGVEYA